MKRRALIGSLGATVFGSGTALTQQSGPAVGLLSSTRIPDWGMTAISKGLAEEGFVDGRNVTIVSRSAEGEVDRLPALATDLAERKVSVILTTGGLLPTRAARAVTATIPIVFAYGGDPVADGLVTSLNRPGWNVTGATFIGASLSSKRLELLRELVPRANEVALLVNPRNALAESQIADTQAAARALGLNLHVLNATTAGDLDEAFRKLAQLKADVLLVGVDPTFGFLLARQLAELTTRSRLPTMFDARPTVELGGLISYGAVIADTWRQAGLYVGRILKGAKVADLPVLQPTKFELVINLKTARAMGLEVPQKLLLAADDVIE